MLTSTTAVGASSFVSAADLTYPVAPHQTNFVKDALASVTPIVKSDAKAVALSFVKSSGLDKNLSLLLLDAAKQDALVQDAIREHGFEQVKAIVVKAITEERTAHEEAWADMLAETYTQHFSAGQMSSIARGKAQSPYYDHLIRVQDEIAREMRDRGAEILAKATLGVKTRIRLALGA